MKISKTKLRQIIKEEIEKEMILQEAGPLALAPLIPVLLTLGMIGRMLYPFIRQAIRSGGLRRGIQLGYHAVRYLKNASYLSKIPPKARSKMLTMMDKVLTNVLEKNVDIFIKRAEILTKALRTGKPTAVQVRAAGLQNPQALKNFDTFLTEFAKQAASFGGRGMTGKTKLDPTVFKEAIKANKELLQKLHGTWSNIAQKALSSRNFQAYTRAGQYALDPTAHVKLAGELLPQLQGVYSSLTLKVLNAIIKYIQGTMFVGLTVAAVADKLDLTKDVLERIIAFIKPKLKKKQAKPKPKVFGNKLL